MNNRSDFNPSKIISDVLNFIASGIALNSIIYPFHPLNYELLKKVFLFKGFLQVVQKCFLILY